MDHAEITQWLMRGDPAIAYQTARDLLGKTLPALRARIATEGWGRAFLEAQGANGGWGSSYYGPKWACTHYVLLDLVNIEFPPDHPEVAALVEAVARRHLSKDGGFGIGPGDNKSDTCVTGMFLNIASHFRAPEDLLKTHVDFLLSVRISDGGFNCQVNRSGCTRSSLHSTVSVLEGIERFQAGGYGYRHDELSQVADEARGFITRHRFFRSIRTGEIINPAFLHPVFPARWYYNTLRALDHFRAARVAYDPAMDEALDLLEMRQMADGRWPRGRKIPGKTLFDMEPPRGPGRWITLQALRVLKAYPRS